jgi:hypothetical protein
LADYEGIELLINDADAKQYTFIFKDQLLPLNPATGRDQSTISYEYDFRLAMERGKDKAVSVYIAWKELRQHTVARRRMTPLPFTREASSA